MHSSRTTQFGISLIEVMVTLAIVAIVVGLALPSLQGVLGGSEMRATGNQLMYSLQTARSEAIKRSTPVALCPSKNQPANAPVCDGTYEDGWIVFVDADQNGVQSEGDEVLQQSEALPPKFSITPDKLFEEAVFFSLSGTSVTSAGRPISGNINISSQSTNQTRTIRIAASGRISRLSAASDGTTANNRNGSGGAT
jgi:type IV fimbrial biogenesis protein FimT